MLKNIYTQMGANISRKSLYFRACKCALTPQTPTHTLFWRQILKAFIYVTKTYMLLKKIVYTNF